MQSLKKNKQNVLKQFLIELLSVRANLYINTKEKK